LGRCAAAPQHLSALFFNADKKDLVVTDVAIAHDDPARSATAGIVVATVGLAVAYPTATAWIAVATTPITAIAVAAIAGSMKHGGRLFDRLEASK
jgi:hypothetical protein